MYSYLITDPSIYSHDKATFTQQLHAIFKKHQPDYALYRDKAFDDYESFATLFVQICKEHGVKAMLHNHAPLAVRLDAYGVHYSSNKLCSIGITPGNLFQVLSSHTLDEIRSAATLGIDAVTYSPIFATPNKGKPVGIAHLKEVISASPLPIIALGGIINEDQIQEVQKAGAWAFASIRYFNL